MLLGFDNQLVMSHRGAHETKQELQRTLEPFENQAKQVEAGEAVAKCRMESNLNGLPTV